MGSFAGEDLPEGDFTVPNHRTAGCRRLSIGLLFFICPTPENVPAWLQTIAT